MSLLTFLPSEVVGEVASIVAHILDVFHQVLLLLLPVRLILLVKRVVAVHLLRLSILESIEISNKIL